MTNPIKEAKISIVLRKECIDLGVSPSGKAMDSDSIIRRFESCHPCHFVYQDQRLLVFFLFCTGVSHSGREKYQQDFS